MSGPLRTGTAKFTILAVVHTTAVLVEVLVVEVFVTEIDVEVVVV